MINLLSPILAASIIAMCLHTRKTAFVGRAWVHAASAKQDWSVEAYGKESDADKWLSGETHEEKEQWNRHVILTLGKT